MGAGEGGVDEIWKKGIGNIGGLHKIGVLAPLCQLYKETLKINITHPHYNHFWTHPPFMKEEVQKEIK